MRINTLFFSTIVLVTCQATGCNSKSSVAEKPAQQGSVDAIRKAVQDVEGGLTKLAAHVDASEKKLTAIQKRLDALIGRGSAPEKLTQFEERIRIAPVAQLSDVVKEYETFRESLKTFEAIELTEKLAGIDWSIEVRRRLAAPMSSDQLLELESLLQHVPRALAGPIAEEYSQQVVVEMLQFAKDVLSKDSLNIDELEVAGDLIEQIPTNQGQSRDLIAELKLAIAKQLEAAVQMSRQAEITRQLTSIQEQLSAARKVSDPDLRRAAVIGLNQAVETARLQRIFEGTDEGTAELADIHKQLAAEVSASLESLALEQRTRLARARMRYQAWTLKEIAKMRDFLDKEKVEAVLYQLRDKSSEEKGPVVIHWADFSGIKKLLHDGIGELAENRQLSPEQKKTIGPFVNANWNKILEQVRHDATVRHILHIDQNLLEPPVAKFYNEAFEETWKALEARDDLRISLARMSAEIRKRSPDSFMENNNE